MSTSVASLLALSVEELRQRLRDDNAYVDSLLARIKPEFYLTKEVDETLMSKYHYGRRGKPAASDEASDYKSQTKKAKRLRIIDPLAKPTISQLQQQEAQAQAQKDQQESGRDDREQPPSKRDKPADKDAAASAPPPAADAAAATGATVAEEGQRLGGSLLAQKGSAKEYASRLKQRLAEIKAQRKHKHKTAKEHRESVANKRKKLKDSRKDQVMTKQSLPPLSKVDKHSSDGGKSNEPTVTFSKFDFGETAKQRMKPKPTPQQILQKVQAEQQRLKELREKDQSKAQEVAEKKAWAKAMQKAEGQKVLDDPNLVKKKVKTMERQKKKSSEEWKQRQDEVTRSIQTRQEQREKNIADKVKRKLDRRRQKAAKKRPGFVQGKL